MRRKISLTENKISTINQFIQMHYPKGGSIAACRFSFINNALI